MTDFETVHQASVDWFTERGALAIQKSACPLETWSLDLAAYVSRSAQILSAMHSLTDGEARGMVYADLISGRPGSWEAFELIAMVRASFRPWVEIDPVDSRELAPLIREWPRRRIDGGQVIADALAALGDRRREPFVPHGSHFSGTSFAMSTTV